MHLRCIDFCVDNWLELARVESQVYTQPPEMAQLPRAKCQEKHAELVEITSLFLSYWIPFYLEGRTTVFQGKLLSLSLTSTQLIPCGYMLILVDINRYEITSPGININIYPGVLLYTVSLNR
jgi:hypothetical protein